MTPYELASLVRIPHKAIASFQRRGSLPLETNSFSRPAALLLTILEGYLVGKYSNDVITNPFPELHYNG